jgi:HPt (histidine-containing phosphotransfer) domain-containing protein
MGGRSEAQSGELSDEPSNSPVASVTAADANNMEKRVDYSQMLQTDLANPGDLLKKAAEVRRLHRAHPGTDQLEGGIARTAAVHSPDPMVPDSMVHVIDMNEALQNMGGSKELLDRMLKKFREEQADSLDELIASFDTGDKTCAHRQAHTLKGIAASISAHELRHNMAALEDALEKGAIDTRIEQLFCEADNAFKQVIAYIDNLKEDA